MNYRVHLLLPLGALQYLYSDWEEVGEIRTSCPMVWFGHDVYTREPRRYLHVVGDFKTPGDAVTTATYQCDRLASGTHPCFAHMTYTDEHGGSAVWSYNPWKAEA